MLLSQAKLNILENESSLFIFILLQPKEVVTLKILEIAVARELLVTYYNFILGTQNV
jgi:hypothetical protein